MFPRIKKYLMLILFSVTLLGCEGGTITGNPVVTLNFDSFTPFAKPTFTNPIMQKSAAQNLHPLAVTALSLCFKRIRLKPLLTGGNEESLLFDVGEVVVNSAGTTLGDAKVPVGTYERIEFDLDDHCPSSYSVQLTNGNGSFVTNDRISIRFEGVIEITGDTQAINMSLQNIVNSLDNVNDNNDIKPFAESVSGSF